MELVNELSIWLLKLPHHPSAVSFRLWGMRPENRAVREGQQMGDAT
jgi:hypothetical protein